MPDLMLRRQQPHQARPPKGLLRPADPSVPAVMMGNSGADMRCIPSRSPRCRLVGHAGLAHSHDLRHSDWIR